MADTDPIMDKIRRDQRRMAWRIWPALSALVVVVGALGGFVGWELGSLPPRPVLVQFDKNFRVEVQVAPGAKP